MTEDQPANEAPSSLSVDAQKQGLIAHLHGEKPPAPAWFDAALARAPERRRLEIEGAGIETLAWGERGKPGLLLLHGNGAHADWWSPLAPFFADDRRVAAITWSGMGASDWREAYSIEQFAREAEAALDALGLFEGPEPPVVVAHSFGGLPAFVLAGRAGDRLGGVVSVDTPPAPPKNDSGPPTARGRANRVYESLNAALARFRLAPAQPCENLYYVDHVARGSIKEVEGGFTWRFDPFQWSRLSPPERFMRPKCPMALMWGERSRLMPPETIAAMRARYLPGAPFIPIPDADHHVMLDQPLAFVAALRALLTSWPRR